MPQEGAAVSHRREKAAPEARSGGGIDALPDEVLQHVLSFLPVPEAVQTCVLARRWRHLWKSMPVLRVTGEGRTLHRRGVRRLNRFVNHLLLLRDRTAPLHACEIELSRMSQDEPQLNLWIQHALLCEARILSVRLSRDNNSFELEDLPLISRHLTRLELCNVVLNDSILDFSSCPALEELWMRGCYIQADMIASQSLKRLAIIDCIFYPNARTRISIPSLVTLALTECWGRTPLLESMPSLVTASVKLADCDDYCGKEAGGSCVSVNDTCENCRANDDGSGDCVLLNGLSEAKSLELIAEQCVFIFKRNLMRCPTFSKLKALLLNEWCMTIDLGALICLLQHTPVLEKLTLQLCQASNNWTKTKGRYNLTEQPFASKKLKVVEIKCEKIDERVHKILTVLSTYGIHIEQINIRQSIGSSEEPTNFPQESGAGPSQARTRRVSHSQNAHLRSMIEQILVQQQEIQVQQQQIQAQQQHIQAQQQHIQTQQQQILAGQEQQRQLLNQILARISEHAASNSRRSPPAAPCPAGSGHTECLDSAHSEPFVTIITTH